MPLRFGSVCSGIEAASVAWAPLGFRPAFYAEIEPFARAVLRARHPGVPVHGDFTTIGGDDYGRCDLLVGGTPCQTFSVAGGRGGLDDDRGKLSLEYCLLADRLRDRGGLRWCLWENVPGALTQDGGRAFASILSGLVRWPVDVPDGGWHTHGVVEPGPADGAFGVAWGVLDAQYAIVEGFPAAVPQRRERLFVVGCLGDWRGAASVLFEPECLRGSAPPRRKARQGDPRAAPDGHCPCGAEPVSGTVSAKWHKGTGGPSGDECYNLVAEPWAPDVAGTLGGASQDGGFRTTDLDNQGAFIVEPLPFDTTQLTHPANRSAPRPGDPCHPLASSAHGQDASFEVAPTLRGMSHDRSHMNGGGQIAVAWAQQVSDAITCAEGRTWTHEGTGNLRLRNVQVEHRGIGHNGAPVEWRVRRLTPLECERLMGFADGYTDIAWQGGRAPDSRRYKALGNSMAVPVMRWIGQRIAIADRIYFKG